MGRDRSTTLFPTDEPLAPDEMIGRAHDLRQLTTQLPAGANLIMAAPRRTGKTTLCDGTLARLADEGFYIAKLDLFKIDDVNSLAAALIEATLSNRPTIAKAFTAARATGRALYENIQAGFVINLGDGESINLSLLPRLQSDPARHLDYALALPQRIAAADDRRLILCIDEFQEIDAIGDGLRQGYGATLKRKMRASFQESSDVSFLFAGSLEHMMLSLFGTSDEPFFHFGSFHQLGPILPAEWRNGLRERLARDRTQIEDQALELLLERSGGQPRSTMLLARHAHLISIYDDTRTITADHVVEGYEQALLAERPKHEAWLDRVAHIGRPTVSRTALRTLRAIARGDQPYRGANAPVTVTRAITVLRDVGLIEPAEGRRHHVIDPLFAEYLRRSGNPLASGV